MQPDIYAALRSLLSSLEGSAAGVVYAVATSGLKAIIATEPKQKSQEE